RTTDTASDIEVGADGFTGLSDLIVVGNPTRVYCRTGRTHRAAQRIGQGLHRGEPIWPTHAAAATHDDLGVAEVDTSFAPFKVGDFFRYGVFVDVYSYPLRGTRVAGGFRGRKRPTPQRNQLDARGDICFAQ